MFPPRPEDLQLPDGSVLVPARGVAALTRLLTKAVSAGRANGDFTVDRDWVVLGASIAEALEGAASGTPYEAGNRLEARGRLLSVSAAAARAGRSERAIRKACFERRLPAVRTGRDWLIAEADLEDYRFRRNHG